MMTDSLSAFDNLTKASVTTRKKTITDFITIKSANNNMKLQAVAFIQSYFKIAEGFTKLKMKSVLLGNLLTFQLDRPIQQ